MTISIYVPDDMLTQLQARWGNLSQRALEAVAVEAYRDEVLSIAEVGRLLGHGSRQETESFLQSRQAYLHYSGQDLVKDIEIVRDVIEGCALFWIHSSDPLGRSRDSAFADIALDPGAAYLIYSEVPARVAELVDALDSGSSGRLGRGGSSPLAGTGKPCLTCG